MSAANSTRAAEIFEEASPYILELLKSAPMHGSCGVELYFYEGQLARVEIRAAVQRKHSEKGRVDR